MILFADKKILVVVAHPDDELLGLGATMHKLIRECNVKTHVIILGEGITSRSDTRNVVLWDAELAIHRKNIDNARRKIGYGSVSTYDFPDNRFDTVPLLDIIKVIEKEKETFQPDFIFTHHKGDVNIDHQRTYEAVITACRPLKDETVKGVITFETASGTEWRPASDQLQFTPNLFYTISREDINAKIEGMEAYEFEKRPFPHPRSPQALVIQAQRWGIALGVEYAEAFCIVRLIID